jgi:hypothetical protein
MESFTSLSNTDKVNFLGQLLVLVGTALIAYSNIARAMSALPGSAMSGITTGVNGSRNEQGLSGSYFF